MDLHLQHMVDGLVDQHADDFAFLHYDLASAVPEVASRWADRYPKAADMHGMTRCTNVRQTLFSIFDGHGAGSFPTLAVRPGPALSVVMTAPGGTEIRVRHWPSDNLGHRVRVVSPPPAGQLEAAAQERQLRLDEGLAEPVLPVVAGEAGWLLFVLWWADQDEVMLEGASLAAVLNIDDASRVQILAATPLPPPQQRPVDLEVTGPEEPDLMSDFDEYDDGTSEAGGTTPA